MVRVVDCTLSVNRATTPGKLRFSVGTRTSTCWPIRTVGTAERYAIWCTDPVHWRDVSGGGPTRYIGPHTLHISQNYPVSRMSLNLFWSYAESRNGNRQDTCR